MSPLTRVVISRANRLMALYDGRFGFRAADETGLFGGLAVIWDGAGESLLMTKKKKKN